jgi:methenyltetrahydrofolate cyclohydrolase
MLRRARSLQIMQKLTDLTVTGLLAALRSPEPAPGGGSASALGGAVGASLLAMVAGLAKPQAETAQDLDRLRTAGVQCASLSTRLAELVDRDSEAYAQVVAAYRLPKGTEDEKAARLSEIRSAMRAAIEAPLDVMVTCNEAIRQAAVVAALGNRNASSDVRVALELLRAGLRGAGFNVEINLGTIKDAAYAERAREDAAKLNAEAETGIAVALARL